MSHQKNDQKCFKTGRFTYDLLKLRYTVYDYSMPGIKGKLNIEKLRQAFNTTKPVIIIAGVAGSGKTTLANALVHDLGIDHRLGTGYIREIAASRTTKEKDPYLFTHSFRPHITGTPVYQHYLASAKAILPSVQACAKRAKKEGQSLIIEGPMILPNLLERQFYDYFVLLRKPTDRQVYYKALTTGTHTKRVIYESDLDANEVIEKEMIALCESSSIPIIPYVDLLKREKIIIDVLLGGLK